MANENEKKIRLADEEEVFLLFYNARSFHVAASELEKLPQTDFFMWPTIVCEAFALELHIKCLLTLRGKSSGNIHEVQKLFDVLDDGDKGLVQQKLEERISIDPLLSSARVTGTTEVNLEAVLRRANRMFVRARYWHEGFTLESIENDEMCTAGICALSDALTQIILGLRPDWTEAKMKAVKLHRKSYPQPPT